jgi:hypothetical protein
MRKLWHDKAWEEYIEWQTKDKLQCGEHYGDR